jgi:hypothetical protein
LTSIEWRQWLGTPAATRLIDRLWPVEVAERAVTQHHDETVIRLAREALLQDTVEAYAEPMDPRRI